MTFPSRIDCASMHFTLLHKLYPVPCTFHCKLCKGKYDILYAERLIWVRTHPVEFYLGWVESWLSSCMVESRRGSVETWVSRALVQVELGWAGTWFSWNMGELTAGSGRTWVSCDMVQSQLGWVDPWFRSNLGELWHGSVATWVNSARLSSCGWVSRGCIVLDPFSPLGRNREFYNGFSKNIAFLRTKMAYKLTF